MVPSHQELLATREDQDQQALAEILPSHPSFKNDQAFSPLQAADMLAWLFRTAFSGQRTRFKWIATELMPSIALSEYAGVFTEERMKYQLALTSDLVLPPLDHFEKWREVLSCKSEVRRRPTRASIPHFGRGR